MADVHRPRFHFTAPRGWMNDPNGMIVWKNRTHLFYQTNPDECAFGSMQWGHAISRDWINWEHLPIALSPTPGGPDKDGAWSGCCVNDNGIATLVYTGVNPQVQCIATARDENLTTWEKFPGNPVMVPPPGIPPAQFRDPFVWRDGDEWKCVVGARVIETGGCVLLYRSRDLRTWEYVGPMLSGRNEDEGRMWECPVFLPLGNKQALIVSSIPLDRAIYFTGNFDGREFHPSYRGTLDWGVNTYYAPHATRDARGRWVAMAWLRESRSPESYKRDGWVGAMTCPRELTLNVDGSIAQQPLQELSALRGDHARVENQEMSESRPIVRSALGGDQLDIAVRVTSLQAGRVGLRVRCSPDGAEQTRIVYDPFAQTLTLDRGRSSLDLTCDVAPQVCPLRVQPGTPLSLRVLIDRSVIEIFSDAGTTLSSRIYPTRADSTGVEIFGHGPMRVDSLDVWKMNDAAITK